jgi:ABC-2 type transport system permease protein
MKLWNNYLKELKIASRGFYFYMEILMAAILLAVLLLFVPAEQTSVSEELLYLDMPGEAIDLLRAMNADGEGRYERAEDTKVRLKAGTIAYYDEQTDERMTKTFENKETVYLETVEYFGASGQKETILYIAGSFDEMLRVTQAEKWYATSIGLGNDGQLHYQLMLFGSETQRLRNLIKASFGAMGIPALLDAVENREVRILGEENALNNRQSYMPLAVVIMNGLMGMMVVIAYLTIDKSSGLIRAMALTPVHTRSYLLSKVLVVLTTSLLSSLVITIPVMGSQPNYLLFILTAALVSVLSCMIGLWIASFFSDVKSAFGVLILTMIILMLPAMSYIIPSFAPLWIKLMPTYPMLEAVKETLLPKPDAGYVLLVCAGMAVVSGLFLWWSERRYRKSLGV